jgi:hypothetical protein
MHTGGEQRAAIRGRVRARHLLADYAYAMISLFIVGVTSFSRLGQVYGARNDYALSEVTRDVLDTVGVWGSNPHAPTNCLNKFSFLRHCKMEHINCLPGF